MTILALDIATKCGWASMFGPCVRSGCVTLRHGKELLSTAEDRLARLLDDHAPDAVFTESPFVYPGRFGAARTTFALNRCAVRWCEINDIPHTEFSPGEVKKHATGKGNANKRQMLEWAQERFPALNIQDDNEADALAVLTLGAGRMR